MPPKKRQKLANSNSKANAPQTISEVAPGRIELKDWINLVHQGRHGYPEKRKWPLEVGGSFLDLVQRCWCDEDALLTDSLTLVKKLGIMDSASTEDDFIAKYVAAQDQVDNTAVSFLLLKRIGLLPTTHRTQICLPAKCLSLGQPTRERPNASST